MIIPYLTLQTQIQPPHDNPFTESYEMTDTSYQGNDHHYRTGQPNHLMNPTYNQAFIPHVYDEEDNDEQEYDQRIQYNQFQGDHFDLAAISYADDESQSQLDYVPTERVIPEGEEEEEEGETSFEKNLVVKPFLAHLEKNDHLKNLLHNKKSVPRNSLEPQV